MSNESENQTTTKDKIPRKSIHFDDAIYYDGVHYFVKTLKHLTRAELEGKLLSALAGEVYQFYGCTKCTYHTRHWATGDLTLRFSENWILDTHLLTKKEKDIVLDSTHHLQS